MNNLGTNPDSSHVVVVGAGFSGLAAAYELVRHGVKVTVLEADSELGGLASGFPVGGTRLERFYHHWFTSDNHVMELIGELGLSDHVEMRPTATGMYFANTIYRLTTPIDVLRFTPLSVLDRFRLGLLLLKARRYKNWRELDDISAADWLRRMAGPEVYRVVWEPLLHGKFGDHADKVSAAWIWSKLTLRGGSRAKGGKEHLAYYRGGFAALADSIGEAITRGGGKIHLSTPARGLIIEDGRLKGVKTEDGDLSCDAAIGTPALPIIADLMEPHVPGDYVRRLRSVEYLANVCLILILDRSLSELYWMNVNDPSFPFVGIIEHTNFEPPEMYAGLHVVYLSKYLTEDDELYRMSDDKLLDFAVPHVRRMFPDFNETWIKAHHVWRARYAQPVTTCGYLNLIPEQSTPIDGFHISTMAQVYPQDRGTNYAIRDGRRVARRIIGAFNKRN